MFYAKYARGYRQGSVSPDSPPGLQTFGPEKVDTYEVGAKTSWQGMIPAVLDVAVFYNNFSDQQIQVGFAPNVNAGNQAGSATTAILNAGKSRIWGAEINATATPFDNFRIDANYAYLNTLLEKLDFAGSSAVALSDGFTLVPTSVANRPLPFTPKNKVTLTGTYTLPLSDSIGKVSVAATYLYWGSIFTAVDPPVPSGANIIGSPFGKLPTVNLLNFNLNWIAIYGSQFDASLFVTNALDRHYIDFVPGVYDAEGFESRLLGEPRMIGARVRYSF
jgi:iron complex outermembrane receptor protein